MIWNYFTLTELCASLTADKMGIYNKPGYDVGSNLDRLVCGTLDPLRTIWGKPIKINSGYRCKELNKAVGGVPDSYHTLGLAADLSVGLPSENRRLYELIKANMETLHVDKVIAENVTLAGCQWVHVQTNRENAKPRHVAILSPRV